MLNTVKKRVFFLKEKFLNFLSVRKRKKQIKNKYSDFFNSIKRNKGKYRINKDGSIDIRCYKWFKTIGDRKVYMDKHYIIETDIPPNTTFYGIISFREINKMKREKNDDLNVNQGYVCLLYCDNVKNIGEGLSARGLFIFGCDAIKKIPDNTKISNGIVLCNSNIQELGKNIKAESLVIIKEKRKNYSIKNIENLEIENLVIYDDIRLKNINKIKNLEIVIGCPAISETRKNDMKLVSSFNVTELIKMRPVTLLFVLYGILCHYGKMDSFLKRKNICYNYLDFKSPNTFFSKLINEEYDLITEEEINKYFNNKKFFVYNNKIPVNIIDYCVSKESLSFIKSLGYKFTKKELEKIRDPQIKSYYEKELIGINDNYKTSKSI